VELAEGGLAFGKHREGAADERPNAPGGRA